MDTKKFYMDKTGKYLGRFLFAHDNRLMHGPFQDGPSLGTVLYFMPNNSETWDHMAGKVVHSSVNYTPTNQQIPDDIEETEQQ